MQSIGLFLLLLGVLVTVHELGHFLVAKACGVKVLRFSIGFGPKLLGFTKGETEYQIAMLPLGGYVKMAGDSPYEELPPEEAHRGFLNAAPWKRALIVVAGPVFNLVFPILVYFFVFVGPQQAISTRVGSVDPSMPAAAVGIRPGDLILSVDGVEVRTFDQLSESFEGRFARPIPVELERNGQRQTVQVTPVKKTETTVIDTVERGLIGISSVRRPPVVGVPPGSPAEQAGLKTFDRILNVNGTFVADEAALREQLAQAQGPVRLTVQRLEPVRAGVVMGRVPSVTEVTLEKQPGEGLAALGAEPADLYVMAVQPGSAAHKAGLKAGDRLLAFQGQPLVSSNLLATELSNLKDQPFQLTWRSAAEGREQTQTLAQAPLSRKDEFGQKSAPLTLGASTWFPTAADHVVPPEQVTVHLTPMQALRKAALVVPQIVGQMLKVLAGLVTRDVPLDTLGGPIMMYQLASKTEELGMSYFLHIMALISINLGVMNLLPIPILDGFHLLSAAWEGIRRRPIPVRVREVANMIGLAMLLLLMGLVMFNDLTR
jgi:regulator of sigma E protease